METHTCWITKDDPEWEIMWDALANDPFNAGLPNPREAINDGEVWQYMGTEGDGEEAHHVFRHRRHPKTNRREYITIPLSNDRLFLYDDDAPGIGYRE